MTSHLEVISLSKRTTAGANNFHYVVTILGNPSAIRLAMLSRGPVTPAPYVSLCWAVALGQPGRFHGTNQMSRGQFDQSMLYVFLVSRIYNTPLTSSRNIQSSIYNTLNQSNPVFHRGVRLTYNDGGTWRASNVPFYLFFLVFLFFFIENWNLNQKESLVAVLQQSDIFMPTKTGSGKSNLPGHLRLCRDVYTSLVCAIRIY